LQKEGINIWLPICAYLSLKDRWRQKTVDRIEYDAARWNDFFKSIRLLSTLGEHHKALRHDTEEPEAQLIALAAGELPGKVLLWTERPKAYEDHWIMAWICLEFCILGCFSWFTSGLIPLFGVEWLLVA